MSAHGLYILGHGITNPKELCFLPPLFTEIAMAENYGQILRSKSFKYSKQPVFSMINDIQIDLVGVPTKVHRYSDGEIEKKTLSFPEMSHTGISIVSKTSKPDASWSKKVRKSNVFDFFTKGDTKLMANVLRNMDLELNNNTKEITATIKYPQELHDLPKLNYSQYLAMLNTLMTAKHEIKDSISSIVVKKLIPQNISPHGQTTSEEIYNINTEKRMQYIGMVNKLFLQTIGISIVKPSAVINAVYKYLDARYLGEHADKLLLHKVIHVDVDPTTTPHFLDYLNKNKYKTNISGILGRLKADLIEARLMESTSHATFKMWSASCRGLEPVEKRMLVYSTLKSVREPHENKPKALRQFADDNTREPKQGERDKFRGLLSPHIIITHVLYPCFLYAMDSDACHILPEFTDEIRGLFTYMIRKLPSYSLNKPLVLRFIELVTPKLIEEMVNSVIWSIPNLDSSIRDLYAQLFKEAFNTLTKAPYNYTIEDIILVFGVVIYNMPTYVDLHAETFKTPLNIHPSEYQPQQQPTISKANNNNVTMYGSIWDLPNSHNSPNHSTVANAKKYTRLNSVMSRKTRKRVNTTSRRSHKKINNTPLGPGLALDGNDLIKLSKLIMSTGKYPYLTRTVKSNPLTYIPRMFQLVTRFDV